MNKELASRRQGVFAFIRSSRLHRMQVILDIHACTTVKLGASIAMHA